MPLSNDARKRVEGFVDPKEALPNEASYTRFCLGLSESGELVLPYLGEDGLERLRKRCDYLEITGTL